MTFLKFEIFDFYLSKVPPKQKLKMHAFSPRSICTDTHIRRMCAFVQISCGENARILIFISGELLIGKNQNFQISKMSQKLNHKIFIIHLGLRTSTRVSNG